MHQLVDVDVEPHAAPLQAAQHHATARRDRGDALPEGCRGLRRRVDDDLVRTDGVTQLVGLPGGHDDGPVHAETRREVEPFTVVRQPRDRHRAGADEQGGERAGHSARTRTQHQHVGVRISATGLDRPLEAVRHRVVEGEGSRRYGLLDPYHRRDGREVHVRGEAAPQARCHPRRHGAVGAWVGEALSAAPAALAGAAADLRVDGDPVALLQAEPPRRRGTQPHDPPGGLVPEHHRQLVAVDLTVQQLQVGSADPVRLYEQQALVVADLGDRHLDGLHPSPAGGDDHLGDLLAHRCAPTSRRSPARRPRHRAS